MKRLLQNRTSGRFFCDDGQWTRDLAKASDFPNVVEAIEVCEKYKLRNMEYVLTFEGKKYDARLPIRLTQYA